MNKKNPLRPLLNIRVIREEQASREFLKRKRALAEAMEQLELRIAEAAAFEQALRVKENSVIDAMISRPHETGNVNSLRRELENWRYRMTDLRAAVEVERGYVAKAEEICAQARTTYMAKMKAKSKTETFSDQWQAAAAKEQEAREEIELEDRIPKKAATNEDVEVETL